ncbi:MAG: DUF1446 domain-containing protein [Comamonadaceae bacterium]|nr:MAG: DUF1446 domain-containing protein [Comamonadaceae bacterium]
MNPLATPPENRHVATRSGASLLIGCAAGFSGDRADAAGPVVDTLVAALDGAADGVRAFLIFETLAERTLALAQLRRRADPHAGYEPLLDAMLRPVLARCLAHRIRIVSNFGAANPRAAAALILRMALELGLPAPRVAVVCGDDLSGPAHEATLRAQLGAEFPAAPIVSANAYIGAEPIAAALDAGADIVVCGRVSDPSLTVGPAMSHFGWKPDDWTRLGRATMAGHLLECGAQVTGGYFADPGFKDVPDLATVGFPIVVMQSDGSCVVGKAADTGGVVNLATVKEQLLYEVHDPAAYLTPDVVADISQAQVALVAKDQVSLDGVQGHARPGSYKVNVCYEGGWLAEAEISYAGARAEARARLAGKIVAERLAGLAVRIDVVGVCSIFGGDDGLALAAMADSGARDVRLRVAGAHADRAQVERVNREVTALYTCGPAGGGGVRTSMSARLNTVSCFVPREHVQTGFEFVEAAA